MQKNKLNLHICGIHLLNPYKTVVSHLKLLRSSHSGYSKASTQAVSSTLLCAIARMFLNVWFVNSNTKVKGLQILFANVVIDNSVKPFSVLGHDGICRPFHSCRFVDN